jgi:hypothetical protein
LLGGYGETMEVKAHNLHILMMKKNELFFVKRVDFVNLIMLRSMQFLYLGGYKFESGWIGC